jgi:hypothetical protein
MDIIEKADALPKLPFPPEEPDGERGLSAGNTGDGDRLLLLGGHRCGRHRRTLSFGTLIGTGSRKAVFYGYLDGAILMPAAAVVEVLYGVRAEMKSLEKVAAPLSSEA